MKINILYEDANILAIDKPSGLAVHSDGRTKPASTRGGLPASPNRGESTRGGEKFLTDWVLKNYPKMKNVGEPEGGVARPGVVHRLDRDTSGVLLLAKNQKSHEFLKQQFSAPALELASGGLADRQYKIKKVYVAIVNGWLKNERGIVNKPIGRSPTDFRKYSAGRGARGEMREAITQYRVLKRFETPAGKFTYVELRPKTGRTHQLRVHMKYLQHSIIGDTLYNPDGISPKGFSRMALHAKSIEFNLPAGRQGNLKGDTIKVESKIPKEFEKILTIP